MSAPEASEGPALGRRLLTVPGVLLAALVYLPLLPLALPATALVDLALRTRLGLSRMALTVGLMLGAEVLGVLAAGALAGCRLLGRYRDEASWRRANFRLQVAWVRGIARGAFAILGLRLEVEDPDAASAVDAPAEETGPRLVFIRHSSFVDLLLPLLLVSARSGTMLRYVVKRGMLWDPCIDIVGHRLPNVFVRRGSADPETEIRRVGRLTEGLTADEGVLIYPEGTRFSESRRQRAMEKAREKGDAEALALAEALTHTLPPKRGGPGALMDRLAEGFPAARVIVISHVGLEETAVVARLWRGKLVGRTIHVRIRRYPMRSLPADSEGRHRWLDERWLEVNAFVAQHSPSGDEG